MTTDSLDASVRLVYDGFMEKTLHLIWEFLCSRTTTDDHLALFRTAATRPVTGHPVSGWSA
jgi:hypothetical protein